jgi:probable HAF family extracellular repeat protein
MISLGDLPGGNVFSRALSVSKDGSVTVGFSDSASGSQAFRWSADDGMTGLGDLAGGAFQSAANAVSEDGSVIVGSSSSANGTEAFLWSNTDGMQSLRDLLIASGATGLAGWTLTEAAAVSADGLSVVGWGKNPDGNEEAWVATFDATTAAPIVPEPASLIIWFVLALALSGVGWWRCRRRNDRRLDGVEAAVPPSGFVAHDRVRLAAVQ